MLLFVQHTSSVVVEPAATSVSVSPVVEPAATSVSVSSVVEPAATGSAASAPVSPVVEPTDSAASVSVVEHMASVTNELYPHDSLLTQTGRSYIPSSVLNIEMAQTNVKTFVSVKVQCTESDFISNASGYVSNVAGGSSVGSGSQHNTSLSNSSTLHVTQHANTFPHTSQHTDTPSSSQLTATDTDSQPIDNHSSDLSYDPRLDSDIDSEMDWQQTDKPSTPVEVVPKYLVFETELDKLFTFCSKCHSPIVHTSKHLYDLCHYYLFSNAY